MTSDAKDILETDTALLVAEIIGMVELLHEKTTESVLTDEQKRDLVELQKGTIHSVTLARKRMAERTKSAPDAN